MLRRISALTAFLSVVILFFTSIVKYFEPQGRVAYWTDWRFLGLDKTEWGSLHLTVGLLFIVSAGFHVYFNWPAILTYLKSRTKRLIIFTPPLILSFGLVVFVCVGTHLHLPPMQQVVDLNDYLKNRQAQKHGSPPYGHAELSSLDTFCRRMGFDQNAASAALKIRGLTLVSGEQTLAQIARANAMSPQQVFEMMRRAQDSDDSFKLLPALPPPGTGKMQLVTLCRQYDLPVKEAIKKLANRGIEAQGKATIQEIARKAQLHPVEVYSYLRQ